jgi:hypothetical protein
MWKGCAKKELTYNEDIFLLLFNILSLCTLHEEKSELYGAIGPLRSRRKPTGQVKLYRTGVI